MGPEHPVVAISLQTLGHVLRLRRQLDEALQVAKRCEALRSASSSQAQGPQMAAALYLQVSRQGAARARQPLPDCTPCALLLLNQFNQGHAVCCASKVLTLVCWLYPLQALIYSDMGSLGEAYEKAQAALSMRQKVLSSDHPDLAHSLTGEEQCRHAQ